jgi:hypothetical protein
MDGNEGKLCIKSDGTPLGTEISVDGVKLTTVVHASISVDVLGNPSCRLSLVAPIADIVMDKSKADFTLSLVGDEKAQKEWLKARLYELEHED